ncbi:MAG TPA: hypothetical protein VGM78_05180 [Ilumatobacteraceae bacterium]
MSNHASRARSPRRLGAALAAMALLAAGCGTDALDSTDSGSTSPSIAGTALVSIGAGLSGEAGLSATQYGVGLANVAVLAFDSSGRLWAGTADYADDGTDGVYVVTAAGATPTKVIAGEHTVLGLLWVGNELFVASKASVVAYSGFDGTSFASHRTVIAFPSDVGEVNALALSASGRIVVGVSSSCDACTPTEKYSAGIMSFLPDGTDLQVYASDIRAAVGLAFYPGTDTLLATMNQRDDLGDATPGDWLSVVSEGQSWGFPDCYGQGGSCATEPGPIAVLDKHAAVSDVAVVTGQLGTSVGDAAIVAEWATGKLLAVSLDPSDLAATSTATVFLTGVAKPVAVVVGPDGALYTGDWASGTLYRIAAA